MDLQYVELLLMVMLFTAWLLVPGVLCRATNKRLSAIAIQGLPVLTIAYSTVLWLAYLDVRRGGLILINLGVMNVVAAVASWLQRRKIETHVAPSSLIASSIATIGLISTMSATTVLSLYYMDMDMHMSIRTIKEQHVRDWLARGAAVFNPKNEMTQGVHETVTLRIVADPNDPRLARPMLGGSPTYKWQQDVSMVMRAELQGSAFQINAITPAEQFLRQGYYEWAWDIVPEKWGKQQLRLVTSVLAPIHGMGEKASIANVTIREIHVMVNPNAVVSGFIVTYWQWLISTALIPVAAWLWTKMRKQNRQPAGFRAG